MFCGIGPNTKVIYHLLHCLPIAGGALQALGAILNKTSETPEPKPVLITPGSIQTEP